jgi:dTDP-4-amino-4,6-dideoxygalactose transaminase
MAGLLRVADAAGLFVLEDCAQAHGARLGGRLVGTFGHAAAFSFYPTKNLGAFGDAGAVVTRDPALADRLRRLRNYGQAAQYDHAERGVNSRMDEAQAAVLRVVLPHLDGHNAERARVAARYRGALRGVALPPGDPGVGHAYHLFVVRHPDRDGLRGRLATAGVGTGVHYPRPVHLQPAYADLGYPAGSLPAAERAAREVLSLPLFVGLTDAEVGRVCAAVNAAAGAAAA